jgi:hypothetical protein
LDTEFKSVDAEGAKKKERMQRKSPISAEQFDCSPFIPPFLGALSSFLCDLCVEDFGF